jgi:hypothetical protein
VTYTQKTGNKKEKRMRPTAIQKAIARIANYPP